MGIKELFIGKTKVKNPDVVTPEQQGKVPSGHLLIVPDFSGVQTSNLREIETRIEGLQSKSDSVDHI